MKAPFYIDTNQTDPIAHVGLQFTADTVVIINPTRFTIAVRVGSGSRPEMGNADMVCAPVSALCLPTEAREFVFLATTPALVLPPDGMPTRVSIMLTRDEPSPAFGSISLAGQPPARAKILYMTPAPQSAGLNITFPLPDGINRVEVFIAIVNLVTIASLALYDATLGYGILATIAPQSDWRGTANVSSSLSSSLGLFVTYGAGPGTYSLIVIGYSDPLPVGSWRVDGRQVVDVMPPGATSLPVGFLAPPSVVITPNPLPVQPWPDVPALSDTGHALVNNPAATTVVLTVSIAVAGEYRVEVELAGTAPVAIGNYLRLAHSAAGFVSLRHDVYAPHPCSRNVVWSRITALANDIIWIQSFGALGAGAWVGGEIRAYKIA